MNALMKKCCWGWVMLALALAPAQALWAQSAAQPSIVISIASLDEQMADLTYFAEAAGVKPMVMMAKAQIDGFTKGIDRTKPAGAMMFFEGGSPEPKTVFFVPISKLDDVLDNLANFAELDEDSDPMRLNANGRDFFIKHTGGYAFVSDQEGLLSNLPSRPDALVGDLPSRFNFGARLHPQRIPQELRDQIVGMIEQGYQQSLDQMGEDFSADLQRRNFEMQMAQIKSMINETEELVLGFSIDQKDKNLHFDAQMVGQSGSVIAKAADNYKNAKPSRFQGFLLDGAAFTANASSTLSAEDVAQASEMLEGYRKELMNAIDEDEAMEEDERQFVEEMVGSLFDVLGATMEAGSMDMGAAIVVDDSSANLAIGMMCSETSKLEEALRKAARMAQEKAGDKVQVQLDAEKKFGANFHKVVIPIPEHEEEPRKLIGDAATICIGIGPDVVYFGAGSGPMPLLEKAIRNDSQSGQNAPMDMNVFLAPILRKVAQMQGEENVQAMADKLAESKRDRIRFSAGGIERGVTFRMEIQDGILELIGVAAQQMGGMMGGGGADF